jgi:hypothetical protein
MWLKLCVVLGVLGLCVAAPSYKLRTKRSQCEVNETPRVDVDASKVSMVLYSLMLTCLTPSKAY